MSMSEFERQENTREKDDSFLSIQRCNCPGDFTEEDLDFARELNALFSPEEEELPPYYVQTLLDADDQRFDPAERGFEHKTSARVFRRLKLRRRLFYTHTSPLSVFSSGMSNASTRRSLLAMAATFVLIMLLTVAFTGPSFVSGVAILLRGTHGSGVLEVKNLPQIITRHQQNMLDTPKEISRLTAQQQMHFPIYWPDKPFTYSLEDINLYVGLNQQWADGPMLEFEYRLPPSVVASKGTGKIWIREFKPKADVLQLVKEGASVPIQVDSNSRALAIYVDGQWERLGKNTSVWVYGQRSELVYQINGVVFWIVGDQRDGIGEQQLMQIAQGLTPLSLPLDRQYRMDGGDTPFITQLSEDTFGPFLNDVIMIFPSDGSDGPYYMNVSPFQPPKTAH